MPKLSEILSTLAVQSGVASDDANLVALIGNTSLASIEVPDEISTRLTAPRLTMDAAKANPDLKKHFHAQAMNGVDAYLLKLIGEHGLPDDAKSEIESEPNTAKKISILTAKIKGLEAEKVGANKVDKTELEKKITELNNEMANLKTGFAQKEATLLSQFDEERTNHDLKSFVLSQNLNLPDQFDPSAKFAATQALYNSELQAKGIKIVRKDGVLSLQTAEGTDYFDPQTNQKVSVNDFVLKTLANKGALKASTGTPPPPRPNPNPNPNPHNAPTIEGSAFAKSLDGMIEEAK